MYQVDTSIHRLLLIQYINWQYRYIGIAHFEQMCG